MRTAVDVISGGQATRLFVTGHSMGGALAVLAAADFELDSQKKNPVTAVYTYGQTFEYGDPQFSAAYDAALKNATFRYVNDLDIVPHLPPARLPATPTLSVPPSAFDFLQGIASASEEIQASLGSLIDGDRFAHVGQLLLFLPDGSNYQ